MTEYNAPMETTHRQTEEEVDRLRGRGEIFGSMLEKDSHRIKTNHVLDDKTIKLIMYGVV